MSFAGSDKFRYDNRCIAWRVPALPPHRPLSTFRILVFQRLFQLVSCAAQASALFRTTIWQLFLNAPLQTGSHMPPSWHFGQSVSIVQLQPSHATLSSCLSCPPPTSPHHPVHYHTSLIPIAQEPLCYLTRPSAHYSSYRTMDCYGLQMAPDQAQVMSSPHPRVQNQRLTASR